MLKSSWCKSSPANAVACRPEASVAIRRVTGGCEAYTVRKQAMRVQLRNRRVAMPTPLAERKAISGQPLMRGCSPGSPESLAQGMFSQRLPVNPGELPVSSRMGCGSPVDKRTWSAVAAEGRRQKRRTSDAEVTCRQGKPEAAAKGRRAVLRTHSTDEGGEPQGSRKGRPRYPLEGRGKQGDESMRGCMPETQISEKHVKWT